MSKKLFFVSISLVVILILPIFSLGQTTGQAQAGQMQAGQAQVPSLSQIDCSQYTNTQEKLMCTYFNTLLQLYILLIQQLQAKIGIQPVQLKLIQPIQQNQPSITVLYPNGGEILIKGSVLKIKWNTQNANFDYVIIDLIRGPNNTYVRNISTRNSASAGEITWQVPQDVPDGYDYKIRISGSKNFDSYDANIFDYSDGHFSILTKPILYDLYKLY